MRQAQGERAVVATGADMSEVAEAHGTLFHEAGAGLGTWFERLGARIRGAPGDGLPPERINSYFVPRLFAEIADDYGAEVRQFNTPTSWYEPYAFACPLVSLPPASPP